MLCGDSIIYVCVGFPFKDKGRLAISGGNRPCGKTESVYDSTKEMPERDGSTS
nr:MAG TPA: hypothetical protein [Microviridae sp.]